MTKFYGENIPFTTATPENYSKFANDFLKNRTLPTVSPWGCHVSNTWQNSESQITSDDILKDWQAKNEVKLVIAEDGTPKILLVSAPAEHEIAFIDWISFTLKRYTFMDDYIGLDESLINDVCIYRMGQKLEKIFGFKLGQKRKNGKNFYEQCYEITNHEGVGVGDLCIGGQANSILVMINGQGCLMGDYGWQNRLYDFLKQSQGVKITRLDLAHDDYDGTYLNIDDLNERESNKEFYYFGKPARVTWYGDWKYLEDGKCRAKRRCVTCNYEENSTRHQFRWDHKDSNCRMIEICTRCGEIKKGLTVHSWINSDGKGKKICKDCGCNG